MKTRRNFIHDSLAAAMLTACSPAYDFVPHSRKIPVILDTDIGNDIDDTWALLMLLRMPEFDLKLAIGDYGQAIYRSRLLAKLLDVTGRSDVPVGIGLGLRDRFNGRQAGWLKDYRIEDYPGPVFRDGVNAIIETIMTSRDPVTLLCLGPVPNIAEALAREPAIAEHARFVGMHGSIYRDYCNKLGRAAEYNVVSDPVSLQKVFAAPWECTITPIDTCGRVKLDGENYQRIYQSADPWLRVLMDNYAAWLSRVKFMEERDLHTNSSILYDTAAVYLAQSRELFEMEELPLSVTDDGYTIIDAENGRLVNCAVRWKDLSAFEALLVDILMGRSGKAS